MSAQEREWQPGDKALVEVEVVEFGDQPEALVHVPRGGGPGVQAIVRTSDLRPVPAGGEVEAATEDVIERAARAIADYELADYAEDERTPSDWTIWLGTARDLARAGLLVGGVPGRSEAEIKAEGEGE